MKEERFKLIASAYLLFIKDGKILLLRRKNTGYEDGNYSMVAGHADGNETMREAIARESKEEADITIDPLKMEHILTMHRWCGDHERIGFYFTVDKWEGKIKNAESHKCDDLSWFPLDELPENTIPYIKTAIYCHKNNIRYCEFGWKDK